jgi:FAD/FMN-containing dehydrogenase
VLALFRRARSGPFTLSAFEFFTERCLARVLRHRKVTQPFAEHDPEGPAHYVLVEVERPREASGEPFDAWLTSLAEDGVIEDGVMAQSSTEAAQLWSLRESISESLSATGLPHKNDIALPIAALEPFCAAFEARMQERWPGWEVCLFGHIGDGNLHVNVMKPDTLSREAFFERTGEADKQLFELVRAHGGSISAEHGIGLLKKPYLAFSRSPEELALMRGLKAALDPHGILNPGKIL